MSLFSLHNIHYKNILSIPTLEIREKKLFAIYGKTGLGKTTLLKLLVNLISPDAGTITYNNHDIASIPPQKYREEVMMLPQHAVIFETTIRDDMLIGVRLHKLSRPKDTELKKLLELLHLDKKLDSSTKNLSGGEKQRLALARALLLNPKVLLLDEPTAHIDEATEKHIIKALIEWAQSRGTTLIFATHSERLRESCGINIFEINHTGSEGINA